MPASTDPPTSAPGTPTPRPPTRGRRDGRTTTARRTEAGTGDAARPATRGDGRRRGARGARPGRLPLVPVLAVLLVLLLAAGGLPVVHPARGVRRPHRRLRRGAAGRAFRRRRPHVVRLPDPRRRHRADPPGRHRRPARGVGRPARRRAGRRSPTLQAVVNTEVVGAGVTRADAEDATVLLVIQSTQESTASPQAAGRALPHRGELEKADDRWLLSGIKGTEMPGDDRRPRRPAPPHAARRDPAPPPGPAPRPRVAGSRRDRDEAEAAARPARPPPRPAAGASAAVDRGRPARPAHAAPPRRRPPGRRRRAATAGRRRCPALALVARRCCALAAAAARGLLLWQRLNPSYVDSSIFAATRSGDRGALRLRLPGLRGQRRRASSTSSPATCASSTRRTSPQGGIIDTYEQVSATTRYEVLDVGLQQVNEAQDTATLVVFGQYVVESVNSGNQPAPEGSECQVTPEGAQSCTQTVQVRRSSRSTATGRSASSPCCTTS